MKGVFKLRPPIPKYDSTWDVKIVLDFLRKIDNNTCSLKELSLKCTTLLALVTGQRMQTLNALNLSLMMKFSDKIIFSLHQLMKTSKPNSSRLFEIFRYSDDLHVCPVESLLSYIKRTEDIRTSDYLFVSFVKPHAKVSTQSLSRWVSLTLHLAGVPFHFSAHSTRGAASSKAIFHIDIQTILKTVGWKHEVTFAKFYNKPLNNNEGSFAETVLSNN